MTPDEEPKPVEGAPNGDEPHPTHDAPLAAEPNGSEPEAPEAPEAPEEPPIEASASEPEPHVSDGEPTPVVESEPAVEPARADEPRAAEGVGPTVEEPGTEPEPEPAPVVEPAVEAEPVEEPAVAESAPEPETVPEAPAVSEPEPAPAPEAAPAVEAPAAKAQEPEISSKLAAEIEEALQAAQQPEPEAPPAPAATAPEAAADGDGAVAEAEEEEEAPVSREFLPGDWFVVHTYAGYENKVKTNLESRISSMNMEDRIFEVVIPMEDVMEIKSGKKQVVQRKVFPGYLLVRMDLDDHSWSAVRNTPGVTGFVGSGTKPIPLSEKEVDRILQRKPAERPKPRLEWALNDPVRVTTGPFANFQGMISEIDTDRSKLKVLVNIFGRETPVELGFDQVAKV